MAASGSLRIPPPPVLAKSDPAFNRWLLEVTAVLAAAGGIDPTQIDGWNELVEDVATNTADIIALKFNVSTLQTSQASQDVEISDLKNRAQVFNGTAAPSGALGLDNDWYYRRGAAAGSRLYIKVAGTWQAQAI